MGKEARKVSRSRGAAFVRSLKSEGPPSSFDTTKIVVTDIDVVTLDPGENTVSIAMELPVGDRHGYASYEELIDLDESPPGYLEDAARRLMDAVVRAVREGEARRNPLPCSKCTGACCGIALQQIRLSHEDVERMQAAGLATEATVIIYDTATFSGHVGEFKLVEDEEGGATRCPHLEPWGCSIYEHRPLICREYSPWDCDLLDEDPDKASGLVQLGVKPK